MVKSYWKVIVMVNDGIQVDMFNVGFPIIHYNIINVLILNIENNVLINASLDSYHWNNSMSMFLDLLNIDINVPDDV